MGVDAIKFGAPAGFICSLVLLLLGTTCLPQPGMKHPENQFTLLWVSLLLVSLLGFGADLWKQSRAGLIRRRWRRERIGRRAERGRSAHGVPRRARRSG